MQINNSNSGTDKKLGQKALRAGLWYTISTIMVKAISVITTPIFTRMMSKTDYGIAATFTSWYTLLHVISSLDLKMSVGRAKQDYPQSLGKYIGSLQVLSALFTGIMILAGAIFINPLSRFMEMDYISMAILGVYLLLSPAVNFAQTRFRYEYRYKGNIAITIYTSIVSTLLTLVLMFVFKEQKYLGKILGAAIPTCLLGCFFWAISIKRKETGINKEYWKYASAISIPMLIHTVSLNLLATSDRVVITKMCGADYTAIYTLSYQYAILINIIMNAVRDAWQPWFHDNYYIGNCDIIRKRTKNIAMLGSFIGIGCICFAPEAIRILGPDEYYEGVYAVAPIVVGVICQFMYSNYINIELHLKNTKYASAGTVIAAILNIGLNIIFVPIYGFVAAAYTTLFSYLVLLGIHYYITRYILKTKLYDDFFFVICILAVAAAAVAFTFLYNRLFVRIIIMTAIGFIFVFLNKEFLLNYKNLKKKA